MLDKKDAQWWILEAQKHPESAADLIRMLADRLTFLDKQNEELRGELVTLKRKQRGGESAADVESLQQRIRELEAALRQNGTEHRLLIYAADRIEANLPFSAAQLPMVDRKLPGDVALLVCGVAAQLLIVTAESQVFNVTLGDLPMPEGSPALLGNPRNVAAILDQAVFERCRFLTLLTQHGYVYSVLAGTVTQAARRQDKLIRNLIPGDPIVAAIPSYNGDLVAVSQKGRWTRFSEKSIAGSGSLAMELPKGDLLVGIVSLARDADLVLLTTDGKLFVRSSKDLAARKAPGTSAGLLFKGISIQGIVSSDELIVLTEHGKVLMIRLNDLPYRARTDTGIPLPGLSSGDSMLTFAAR